MRKIVSFDNKGKFPVQKRVRKKPRISKVLNFRLFRLKLRTMRSQLRSGKRRVFAEQRFYAGILRVAQHRR